MMQRSQKEIPSKGDGRQTFEVFEIEDQRQRPGDESAGCYGEEGRRWAGYPLGGYPDENLVGAKPQRSAECEDDS